MMQFGTRHDFRLFQLGGVRFEQKENAATRVLLLVRLTKIHSSPSITMMGRLI